MQALQEKTRGEDEEDYEVSSAVKGGRVMFHCKEIRDGRKRTRERERSDRLQEQ